MSAINGLLRMDSLPHEAYPRGEVARRFRELVKGSSWVAVSGVFSALLGLLQLAIIARALGVSLFGHLTVVIAVATLIAQFFDFRTWELAGKHVVDWLRAPESAGKSVACLLALDVATGLGAAACLIIVAEPAASLIGHGQVPKGYFTAYALVVTLTMLSSGTASGALRAMNKFKSLAGRSIVSASSGVLIIFLATSISATVLSVIGALAVAEVFNVVLTLALLRRSLPSPLSWSATHQHHILREIKGDLWSTWFGGTVKGLQASIDTPLVAFLVGPSAAGLYRFAMSIGSHFSKLGNPIQAVILPLFATMKNAGERLTSLARWVTLHLALGVLPLLGLLVGFRSLLVDVTGGRSFHETSDMLLWILPGVALNVILASWVRPAVVVRAYWRVQNNILLGSGLVATAGYLFAVPKFGAQGAAAVTGGILGLTSIISCVAFFFIESRVERAHAQ